MVACSNHGNCTNGKKNSRPSSRSQKPVRDTLVNSTAEVLLPRCADLILMLPNQAKCSGYGAAAEAVVLRKFDLGFKPELRLATRSLHMDVRPLLFPRKKIETQAAGPEDRRTHARNVST